ncbi:hypothetical protein QZM22_15560 [Burkholderia oklahomensis]|uniref:hypothetical protein n=1 Tax=Burkholderia oklahomensis TaxID=342113 RepID=UPI00264C39AA|nr:hypothetical protein [Burkholderia oklahomensis]MDN7673899.1 hypothetical protein [Burkholderia oklahomensis]
MLLDHVQVTVIVAIVETAASVIGSTEPKSGDGVVTEQVSARATTHGPQNDNTANIINNHCFADRRPFSRIAIS